MQREIDVGIDEYDTFESRQDIIQLGGIGLEELTTGRDIEKQIADKETAAHSTGTWFLTLDT